MTEKTGLFEGIEGKLGYLFRQTALLEQALTHRSYANEKGLPSGNETLALLGDAVLQFFVTERLYRLTPWERPGTLTEKRKVFVCEESLSEKAKRLHLGEAILFGRGEKQQGGALKPSHLSETFEALVGSIYLDGGLDEATSFLCRQFKELGGLHDENPPVPKRRRKRHQRTYYFDLERGIPIGKKGLFRDGSGDDFEGV